MPLTYEESLPLVGQQFMVHTQQGLIALTLTEAKESPRRGLPDQFRTPLSLIFTACADTALIQESYCVEHPQIGTRQWMFVPILPPPIPQAQVPGATGVCYYQVLFA